LRVLERQIAQGIDYITVHASITNDFLNNSAPFLSKRLLPLPSRAGGMLVNLFDRFRIDNPINGAFKQIACLCAEAGVAISLGSSFRSAAIADAFDEVQQMELLTQSRLIEAAGESGVQILLEGISHALPQDLEQYITLAQKLCPGIPITALGPLPIDIAVGLDHIAAAIGITFARLFGISLVNIVTSMEHVGMPSLTEIVDALRAARVGLGVADTILTGKHSFPDKSLSKARNNLDWSEQCRFALFPEILAELVSKKGLKNGVSCTICKENCPLKSIHLLWKCAGLKKGFPNGEGGKNEK
jgi:phosphomethylpyrimidine synthase